MTTQTQTLTDFLLARIAEDEEVARRVRPDEYLSTRDDLDLWAGEDGGYAHVAITSGRVLAECAAKRRIVAIAEGQIRLADSPAVHWDNWRDMALQTLAALALPYADHPDFREEWRV